MNEHADKVSSRCAEEGDGTRSRVSRGRAGGWNPPRADGLRAAAAGLALPRPEVSTNIAFGANYDVTREIVVNFALDAGCSSNCLLVAFGRDADHGGVLGPDEAETLFGWRNGRCFAESVKDGVRIEESAGEGSTARRRLVRRYGFDEQGELDETRDYWSDAGSRRHARLKSVRSSRQAWSFHDYDERGRETVRLEQLDGSPFPDGLAAVSHLAGLPAGCSAKATVTSYVPATGDSDDRNDVDQPRRRDLYVLRAGRDPVLIGTETWLYTRSTDSAGVPLRTCVHSTGIGSTLRSETTVEHPEGDYAVPRELRGRAVSSLDFDGVLATHVLERGTWDPATRTFAASPSGDFLRATTRRSRDGVSAKTYTVSVENALRHLEVYRAELLTADDAPIDWSASSYDDVDRLRVIVYPDGTSYAYAYDNHLLCTNETLRSGDAIVADVLRTFDDHWRNLTTAVLVTNVPHTASTRHYDDEDRIGGYAFTNAAGRGVSVAFAYNGSYLTNAIYTLSNGNRFTVNLTREMARRELVTHRAYLFNASSVCSCSTGYDLIGRPTNAVDSLTSVREWLYNRRSELVAAQIGTNAFGYAYDTIGNRIWYSANAYTNSYTANCLNQYSSLGWKNFVNAKKLYWADGHKAGDETFGHGFMDMPKFWPDLTVPTSLLD